jgi:hypothetical protein
MYIVYDIETTKIVKSYDLERTAKALVTRLNNEATFAVIAYTDEDNYYANIEKMIERTNLMTGKKFLESVNVPYCCSPSSETYWSS